MSRRAQRLIHAANKSVPEGTFAVGAGLLIAGIAAYGFQILSFRTLTEVQYAALNGLWVLTFVAVPGVFLPLEQEVSRAIAHRRVNHEGGGPIVKRAALLGNYFTLGLVVFAVVAAPALNRNLFHGSRGLVVCFIIALPSFAVQHLTRGVLSGNNRFAPYGLVLALEGLIRLLPTAILLVAGVDDVWAYGLCLAIPPVLASVGSLRGQHGLVEPGPEAEWKELSTNLGTLLVASVLAQLLGYAAFLGANLLADTPAEKTAVASFLVGLFLARIPILLFQAVQAALLPKLAGLAGAGRHDDFRQGLRTLILVVVGIGVIGVIGAVTLGPWVGGILFGDKFTLGSRNLALLAAGSGLFILALTLAQALIALLGHSRAAIAWGVGVATFVGVTAVAGNDLFLRVELGFIAGAAAATVLMGLFLGQRMRAGVEGSVADLMELIEHEPLEL